MSCSIRPADAADASWIANLYGSYVRTSTATFEIDPPDVPEILARFQTVSGAGLPWLVAELDGQPAGYAYATQFRPRPAYRFTVEDSVYIEPAFLRRGVATALITHLIDLAHSAGMRQMVAAIGGDNPASVALHTALGFTPAGVLHTVGWKFDRWLDLTLLQRTL